MATSAVAGARRLKGHSNSVLCCVATEVLLASGSEDGKVCIHDLRSNVAAQKYKGFGGLPVASLCFKPGSEETFYAAAGPAVFCFDLRLGSAGTQLASCSYNEDDINQITVNRNATYLAASDDTGQTKIIDLSKWSEFKSLRGGHSNICSSVQFHPQRPWEVVTGGLDCKIIKWDFSRPRTLAVIDTSSSSSSDVQVFNPPFVHALACPENSIPGEAGRLVAAALGDGSVHVYDTSLQEKKASSSAQRKASQVKLPKFHFSGHTAPVSHVTFAKASTSNSLIVSGGNDGKLNTWDSSVQAEAEYLKSSIDHGKKVNWMATSSQNLVVADTSKFLTVYPMV